MRLYAFSGHKVYGPTGIGVLWIKKEFGRKLPDLLWGGGKKTSPLDLENKFLLPLTQKFEVGTLPLAQIFGLKASFEFLNSLDIKEISAYEKELKNSNQTQNSPETSEKNNCLVLFKDEITIKKNLTKWLEKIK